MEAAASAPQAKDRLRTGEHERALAVPRRLRVLPPRGRQGSRVAGNQGSDSALPAQDLCSDLHRTVHKQPACEPEVLLSC